MIKMLMLHVLKRSWLCSRRGFQKATSTPLRLCGHIIPKGWNKYHLQPSVYTSNTLKERIQNFLGARVTFLSPLNASEPHLIVCSNLSETALKHLLKEPNQQWNLDQESRNDELINDAIEDVDLDAELLSWLYRVSV